MSNKVLAAFRSWEDRQKLIDLVGSAREDQRIVDRLKLAHFQQCRHQLSATLSAEEKPFLPLLNNAISRLEKQVYPGLLSRLFFQIKDRFFDRPAYLNRSLQQQQENVVSLKRQLDKAGLSSFSGDLEKHLRTGLPVDLACQLDQNRSLKVTLHFTKNADETFKFSRIDAGIGERQHQFKHSEWPGLDMVQVKNLLEGRAIRQDYADLAGKQNSRWLELAPDGQVKQYLKDYGFEPEKLLATLPFANKEGILQQLEKGHLVKLPNGYVQADPASSGFKLFDTEKRAVTEEHFKITEKKQAVIKQMTQAQAPKRKQTKSI
jgi:hypothetical protein